MQATLSPPPLGAFAIPYKSGGVFTSAAYGYVNTNPGGTVEGGLRLSPIVLPGGRTINRIGVYVTVVGSAGAGVRCGIYAADTAYNPIGAPLLDSGFIATDAGAGTGLVTGPVNFFVPSTTMYWIGAVIQGGAVTKPTVAHMSGSSVYPTLQFSPYDARCTIPEQSGVSGALPSAPLSSFDDTEFAITVFAQWA